VKHCARQEGIGQMCAHLVKLHKATYSPSVRLCFCLSLFIFVFPFHFYGDDTRKYSQKCVSSLRAGAGQCACAPSLFFCTALEYFANPSEAERPSLSQRPPKPSALRQLRLRLLFLTRQWCNFSRRFPAEYN
jgi:hypothetical protein